MNISNKRYVSEDEAARITGLSARTLQRQRAEGGGIPYIRIGKRLIAYDLGVLEEHMRSRTFASRAAELAQQAAA